MFQRLGGRPDNLVHLDRIEAAVRAHFGLDPSDIVLVAEDRGTLPGFPDRDTTVRFWKGGARYRLRVFKPAAQVGTQDLPVAWLLPSLVDDGDPDCC